MNSEKLIAVDLGSTHISTMAAEVLESNHVKIISEESKPSDDIKWGIVEKHSGASFKLFELLKLLKNSAKISDITHLSVAIGAKSMKQIPLSINRILSKSMVISENLLADMLEECEKKIANPDIKVFEVIPSSYILDGKRMDDPIGESGVQITANYNVIVGNSIIKSKLEQCFDRTPEVVLEYTPLVAEALSTVLIDDEERLTGCALIDLGTTTTTLAVYHDSILQNIMVVPLGANNITKDIQELGISEINAERLKCLKGVALESLVENPIYISVTSVEVGESPVKISTKFLATIIESRLSEILQPIFEIIANLQFELEAGIIVTGGGAKLNGIMEFMTEKTGIDARFGDHSDWLSEDTDKKYCDPKYAQLIGTILLTNDYRIEHPLEVNIVDPKKKPKIPKSTLIDKLADRYTSYFGSQSEIKF